MSFDASLQELGPEALDLAFQHITFSADLGKFSANLIRLGTQGVRLELAAR
jgi:hypothetical protein